MRRNITCKAFCNEERLRLLLCLSAEKTVTEILSHCDLSQSALSQHLKILRDAKIVDHKKSGKNVLYKVNSRKAIDIAKLLLNFK